MATYAELFDLWQDSTLRNRIAVAVVDAATTILGESPTTTERTAWAAAAVVAPIPEAELIMWSLLIQNEDATVAQITSAADASILTAVNTAVDSRIGTAV